MAKQQTGKVPAKASRSPRGERKAKQVSQRDAALRLAVESVLANQERAKKLYQRAGEEMAALVAQMPPGRTVLTRYGTVVMQDAFADGKLTAFKNTAVSRYSLRVVSPA